MILLIKKERPADQKCNVLYFILDGQWFNLTADDMRTAMQDWNIMDPRQLLERLCPNPLPFIFWTYETPIHLELASFRNGLKPDDPHHEVDKSLPMFPPTSLPI